MTLAGQIEELADAPAETLLEWAFDRFGGRAAVVTAFQAEGMVALDLAHRINPGVRVLTVDTGRLPQETFDLIDDVRARYGIEVEVVIPDGAQVGSMVKRHGVNLFQRDKVLRELCCHVRKVLPLDRALVGLDAWITGLRRTQSDARAATPKVERDPKRPGVVKVNPLADWTRAQVWAYIEANHVPVHALYAQGFTSIGCAPCTRAVAPGEGERAGRWWWEADDDKECGIHGVPASERLEQEIAWLTRA